MDTCTPYVMYIVWFSVFVLSAFMVFNQRMEFAGICTFFILYACSLALTGYHLFTLYQNTDVWINTLIYMKTSMILATVSLIFTTIATGLTLSVFVNRVAAKRKNGNLDFGHQETRKNSLKKLIVATFVFSTAAYILSSTTTPIEIITSILESMSGIQSTKSSKLTAAKSVIYNITIALSLVAIGLSFSSLVQASILAQHFA